MEDVTVRIGLLMEAVESQRTLVSAALQQLQQHSAGLDAVVRDEIRATLGEELRTLAQEGERAAQSLRCVGRAAHLRLTAWTCGITALAGAIPLALCWWLLPTRADVAALRATRDELAANVTHLTQQGGRVQLRRCGSAQRLCVRVERDGRTYGEGSDYVIVRGY